MAKSARKRYKRRSVLRWVGLATGAFVLPATIRAAVTSQRDNAVLTATPTTIPHTVAAANSNISSGRVSAN